MIISPEQTLVKVKYGIRIFPYCRPGGTLCQFLGRYVNIRLFLLAALCSVFPDIDVIGFKFGESLFLRKLVLRTSCPNKRQKLNATANAFGCPSRPATLASYPTRGMKHSYAMTRRDVGRLRIFTPQTTLRENTQPYRFWGLKIFSPLTLRFQDFQRMPQKVLKRKKCI